MKYQFIGSIAGTQDATVLATVTYLSDYRDPDGNVMPPVLRFEKKPGQEWTDADQGGPAYVYGPNTNTDGVPRVRVTYTVLRPGLPPFARALERRVMPNTDTPGYWDFTRSDEVQPLFVGGPVSPTPVEVLPGQGPKGDPGAGWLSGAGAPASTTGRDHDLYLNTSTWDVFVKTGGSWLLSGNIHGATGGVGPKGDPGADGKSFPVPTEAQLGYVPVADGSQPNGFSWRAPNTLQVVKRLSDIADVDLTGLQTGYSLKWSGTRWVPVAEKLPAPGNAGNTLVSDGGKWISSAPAPAVDAEAVQDIIGSTLVEGDNITLNYDDAAGTLTISAAGGGISTSETLPAVGKSTGAMGWSDPNLYHGGTSTRTTPYYLLFNTAGPFNRVMLGMQSSGATQDVQLEVYAFDAYGDSSLGPLIQRSRPTTIPAGFDGDAYFTFPDIIQLSTSPTQCYLLIKDASGGNRIPRLKGIYDWPSWTGMDFTASMDWDTEGTLRGFDNLVPWMRLDVYTLILDPKAFPTAASTADIPEGGQALLTSPLPPRWVYRHTDGTLYYGPAYSTTP